MEDLKLIIAKNIIDLRKRDGITQAELAECLNYTDKAVSKWERGASLPDIVVLKEIADLFNVTVDYLVNEEHKSQETTAEPSANIHGKCRNRGFITGMSILLVWLVAAVVFFVLDFFVDSRSALLVFAYAVPISMIVWLIFNSLWFNKRRNFIIISVLMWTVLISAYLSVLCFGKSLPLIYILGIPGQAIIIMWSRIRKNH